MCRIKRRRNRRRRGAEDERFRLTGVAPVGRENTATTRSSRGGHASTPAKPAHRVAPVSLSPRLSPSTPCFCLILREPDTSSTHPSAMYLFPNKILGLAFAEVYTGDSRTGRSLSSISQLSRSTSRRYALQFVALYGHYKISILSSLLDQVDCEDRCVCHLYLTYHRRVSMEYPAKLGRNGLKSVFPKARLLTVSRLYRPPPLSCNILPTVGPTIHSSAIFRSTFFSPPLLSPVSAPPAPPRSREPCSAALQRKPS